ncbi:hypothetical protein ALC53_07966 [Atta colombica]|uniref:Uncharacterized protein n=1 Tax=Atta colombica TaxID=520822 RepID=A0A195BBK5_9HYME|nr:hypothetical protein ALC53_07966 [Atta colombica]
MGGSAPAVPRLKSNRQLPERWCHPGTGQDRPASGGTTVQTDEESFQHHEAVQPHETRFHDQHRRQQTCRNEAVCESYLSEVYLRDQLERPAFIFGDQLVNTPGIDIAREEPRFVTIRYNCCAGKLECRGCRDCRNYRVATR